MTSPTHSAQRGSTRDPASRRQTHRDNDGDTTIDPLRSSVSFGHSRNSDGLLYDAEPVARPKKGAPNHNPPKPALELATDRTPLSVSTRVAGFTAQEQDRLREANRKVEISFKTEESFRSNLSLLYAQLATFNPFPKDSFLQKMTRFLSFGLLGNSVQQELNSVQESISAKVKQLRELQSQVFKPVEREVRREFKNRSFLVTESTPQILKRVSLPEGKSYVSYERLQQTTRAELGNLGSRIKVVCPSPERTIVYRRRPDDQWESLELSWRRPGKVDIIKNGVNIGHLFNCDASEAVKAFVQGKSVNLKQKTLPPDTVWTVVPLGKKST